MFMNNDPTRGSQHTVYSPFSSVSVSRTSRSSSEAPSRITGEFLQHFFYSAFHPCVSRKKRAYSYDINDSLIS